MRTKKDRIRDTEEDGDVAGDGYGRLGVGDGGGMGHKSEYED